MAYLISGAKNPYWNNVPPQFNEIIANGSGDVGFPRPAGPLSNGWGTVPAVPGYGYGSNRAIYGGILGMNEAPWGSNILGTSGGAGSINTNSLSLMSGLSTMVNALAFPKITAVQGTNTPVEEQIACGIYGAFCSVRTIPAELAKIIDDYWSMYGYAVQQTITFNPLKSNRSYFTYIKTKGFSFQTTATSGIGNPPSDQKAAFEHIFNNGVRLWFCDKSDNNYANFSTGVLRGNSLH